MKKILIADDSSTMRLLLKMHLRGIGATIIEAADGQAALDKLSEEPFDMLITDINMPNMTGLELTKAVREKGISIPIIILTTKGEESDVEKGMSLGATGYLTKPVDPKELLNLIFKTNS